MLANIRLSFIIVALFLSSASAASAECDKIVFSDIPGCNAAYDAQNPRKTIQPCHDAYTGIKQCLLPKMKSKKAYYTFMFTMALEEAKYAWGLRHTGRAPESDKYDGETDAISDLIDKAIESHLFKPDEYVNLRNTAAFRLGFMVDKQ
jgi:hypothetical protein